jgi:hypothetical protein
MERKIEQEITTLKGYSRFHYQFEDGVYASDDSFFNPVSDWIALDWFSKDRKYVVDVFTGFSSMAFELNEEGDKEFRKLFGDKLK